MSVLDRAKAHFQGQGLLYVAVPEWAEKPGEAFAVHFTPLTLNERRAVGKDAGTLDVGALADLVILKAKDADGNRLFATADKMQLMTAVDSNVVARIATAMLASAPSAEELEKN